MKKKVLLVLLALFMFMGSVATFPAPVYGKNQETNSHPYAVALRDYLKEFKKNNKYVPNAYLEDINGDGIKEMLVGGERLYYLHDGKLHTYDIEADFGNPDYSMYFTHNNHLVAEPHVGDVSAINVLKLKEGKIIKETEFVGMYLMHFTRYTHEGRDITESEFEKLAEKYGVTPGYSNRENQANEILAMTNMVKAMATYSKVEVNGKPTDLEAYNIGDNNYFKLRDLAQVVNNTEKNYEVEWDGAKNAINLISNKVYTTVGGELAKGDNVAKNTTPTESTIYKDGVEVELTAYTIGENNFFKLRDIAKAFDIGITWDNATKTIDIDTSIGYVAE